MIGYAPPASFTLSQGAMLRTVEDDKSLQCSYERTRRGGRPYGVCPQNPQNGLVDKGLLNVV